MNEDEAYAWTAQAIRIAEMKLETHHYQSLADAVQSAIIAAYEKGKKDGEKRH